MTTKDDHVTVGGEPRALLEAAIDRFDATARICQANYLQEAIKVRDADGQPVLLQHPPGTVLPDLPAGWVKVEPLDVGTLGDFYAPPHIRDQMLRSNRKSARQRQRWVKRFTKDLGGAPKGLLGRLRSR